VNQMNDAFESRGKIAMKGTSMASGRKPLWEIRTLRDERSRFSRLYKTVCFDHSDFNLTDEGTRPIDRFSGLDEDTSFLSRCLPGVPLEGIPAEPSDPSHPRPDCDDEPPSQRPRLD